MSKILGGGCFYAYHSRLWVSLFISIFFTNYEKDITKISFVIISISFTICLLEDLFVKEWRTIESV